LSQEYSLNLIPSTFTRFIDAALNLHVTQTVGGLD